MAEQGNDKQGAPRGLQKADPAGYFKGESMTRRTAFTIGVQAVGGMAVAAVALPAVGFAVAPLFEQEDEPWQAVGPTSDFTPDTYRPVVITAVAGDRRDGQDHRLHPAGQPEITDLPPGYEPETSSEYIAISTRCAHVGCPVRFVQAARQLHLPVPRRRLRLPRASGSAGRRFARSTASRPA